MLEQSPAWLKADVFWDEDYDMDAYIRDLKAIVRDAFERVRSDRRRTTDVLTRRWMREVPLETLRHELQEHKQRVETNLVQTINEEYNEFVGLSSEVMDVEEAVSKMDEPLEDVERKMKSVRADIMAVMDNLQACLARREENFRARERLEIIQDTSHAVSKLEKLIHEMENGPALNYEDAFPRVLERIASELSKIQFYLAKGDSLPSLQNLNPRIQKARELFLVELGKSLEASLRIKSTANLQQCLRSYASVNAVDQAEAVVKEKIMTPLLEECLESYDTLIQAKAHELDQLEPLYTDIIYGVSSRLGVLLRLVNTPHSGLHAFSFLANSVLAQVESTLGEKRASSFSPGIPSMFHKNYLATLQFLEELEKYCISKKKLEIFRGSEHYKSLLKRWNTSVYFTLRFQDVATGLERHLSGARPALLAEPKDGFVLESTAAVWESLGKCFSPDFYLQDLADKFLKLSLQVLARYGHWVEQGLQVPASSSEGVEAEPWLGADPEKCLHAIVQDLRALSSNVLESYLNIVSMRLGDLPADVKSSSLDLLRNAAQKVGDVAKVAQDRLIGLISEKCVAVLKQMRGVTAAYRMTNKPMPTRPSTYVTGAMAPILSFSDMANGDSALVEAVVASVCNVYKTMIKELIETVKKTESSLKRLKKQASSDAVAKVTDTEKICLQLFLDVKEVGRQVKHAGVDPNNFEAYISLWDAAAPEDAKGVVQLSPEETPQKPPETLEAGSQETEDPATS